MSRQKPPDRIAELGARLDAVKARGKRTVSRLAEMRAATEAAREAAYNAVYVALPVAPPDATAAEIQMRPLEVRLIFTVDGAPVSLTKFQLAIPRDEPADPSQQTVAALTLDARTLVGLLEPALGPRDVPAVTRRPIESGGIITPGNAPLILPPGRGRRTIDG